MNALLRRKHAFPAKIANYSMPDCLACEEDLRRMTGDDLREAETVALFAEEQRLRGAIGVATGLRAFVATPGSVQPTAADAWLRWRLRAVQDEMTRRQSRRST